MSAGGSGPTSSAAAFCSACSTVRMPGIGTVRGGDGNGYDDHLWTPYIAADQ
jgi:hypothetical protein